MKYVSFLFIALFTSCSISMEDENRMNSMELPDLLQKHNWLLDSIVITMYDKRIPYYMADSNRVIKIFNDSTFIMQRPGEEDIVFKYSWKPPDILEYSAFENINNAGFLQLISVDNTFLHEYEKMQSRRGIDSITERFYHAL